MPLSNLQKAERIARALAPKVAPFATSSHERTTLIILHELEAIDSEEKGTLPCSSPWPQQEPGIDY